MKQAKQLLGPSIPKITLQEAIKIVVDFKKLWHQILLTATEASFDVATVPQNNRTPLWFNVHTKGAHLYVNNTSEWRNPLRHILLGSHQNGNFICIPNWNIGCELAGFSDWFWNSEQLSKQLPIEDAMCIAKGIGFARKNFK